MFNRRFTELVRLQLISLLSARARAVQSVAKPERFAEDEVIAFVDLQNLHYFLKECRVVPTQTHVPDLLRAFAAEHQLRLTRIHCFTGIHDFKREPFRHESMMKRVAWLEKCGAKVTTIPLSYHNVDGQIRAKEKGVDVRLSSEIFRAVNDGLQRALVVSQDKDITQAIVVAKEMAMERGRRFDAFSMGLGEMPWEPSGKCGIHGLGGTIKLPLSLDLVRRFTREKPTGLKNDVPEDNNASE